MDQPTLAAALRAAKSQADKIGGETSGLLDRIAVLEAEVSRLRKLVPPISWNPISIVFTAGTAGSSNLVSFLKNPQNKTVTYSLYSGRLPTGVTLSGSVLTYTGTGTQTVETVQFQATTGSYSVESVPVALTINPPVVPPNRAPVWSVADNFALPNQTQGVAGQTSVFSYATDPDSDPLTFSRTGGTAPAEVVVSTAGLITIPATVTAGTYTVTVTANDGKNSAENDWISRSTGSGVVWAHDFRSDAEVVAFRNDGIASTDTGGKYSDWSPFVRRITTDGVTGNCLEVVIPASGPYFTVSNMSAASPCVVTTATPHSFVNGDHVMLRDCPAPYNVWSENYGQWGYLVTVLNSTQFELRRFAPSAYNQPVDTTGYTAYDSTRPGRVTKHQIGGGQWSRPFGPLLSGHGLPADINRPGLPAQVWPGGSAPYNSGGYETAYYGHTSYQTTQKTPADWHGEEFWLQYRVKMPYARFWSAEQAAGKLAMMDQTTRGGFVGEWVHASLSHWRPTERDTIDGTQFLTDRSYWPASVTVPFIDRWYTGGSQTLAMTSSAAVPALAVGQSTRIQSGDEPYKSTCLFDGTSGPTSTTACLWWPADEWVTVMVHWKGGRDNQQTGYTYRDTSVEVYVNFANEPGTYHKVYSAVDAGSGTGFPWSFTQPGGDSAVVKGLNCLRLSGYMNETPSPVGWTQRYCQVIFSKSYIPAPGEVYSTSAPTWFTNAPVGTWTTVADTGTISATTLTTTPPGTRSRITEAWTGGCIDQSTSELILAANGGHDDYGGNEIYGLNLRANTPAWQVLKQPSATFATGDPPAGTAAVNADGAMRSVHGWNRCIFAAGRIWYPQQDSHYNTGNSTRMVMSIARNGIGSANWVQHGLLSDAYQSGTSPSAYDSTRGVIWTFGAGYNPSGAWTINTSTLAISSRVSTGTQFMTEEGWAVYCSNIDRIIVGSNNRNGSTANQVCVIDPATGIGSMHTFTGAWSVTGTGYGPVENCGAVGLGAVYDPVNFSIYVYDPGTLGANIKILQIPHTGNTFNPAGTFAWKTYNCGSTPSFDAAQWRGAYSKFQLVSDLGDGQSRALVLPTRINAGTYVMRLPAGGLVGV